MPIGAPQDYGRGETSRKEPSRRMGFDNFAVGSSAVSMGIRRLDERVSEETGLKKILKSLSDQVKLRPHDLGIRSGD